MNNTTSNLNEFIKKESNIDTNFVDKFYKTLYEMDTMINLNDVKEWIGFKKKQTITDILKNDKYGFKGGEDYKIEIYKPETGRPGENIFMTVDTLKSICLMSVSEQGQKFRKYYIEMEKLFKKYVSTEIQNRITNPIIELNKYDFDPVQFQNKEVLYLIHVKDKIYKFGITNDIMTRFRQHKHILKYDYVVKCWECINRTISKQAEDAIKIYAKYNKLSISIDNEKELIQIDNMDEIIKRFTRYVNHFIKEYKKDFRDQYLEQKKELIDKINELITNMNSNGMNNNKNDIIKFINNNSKYHEDKSTEFDSNNESDDSISLDENDISDNEELSDDDGSDIDEDDIINNLKKCSRCKNLKPVNTFKDDIGKEFIQCPDCRYKERTNKGRIIKKKTYHKNYRAKNKEKLNSSLRDRRKNVVQNHKDSNITDINDTNKHNKITCYHCMNEKELTEFGINKTTKKLYVNCFTCREERRTGEKDPVPVNADANSKYKYYDKNKEKIAEYNKLYNENKKKNNTDPDTIMCIRCHKIQKNDQFGINSRTKQQYKICRTCRNKITVPKDE